LFTLLLAIGVAYIGNQAHKAGVDDTAWLCWAVTTLLLIVTVAK